MSKGNIESVLFFNGGHIFLPGDTATLLKDNCPDNFNIKLNKFTYFEDNKFVLFKKDRKRIKYRISHNFNETFLENTIEGYYSTIEKLNLQFGKIELLIGWRMVIGLGAPSVYETSMTLHHIYGFPYIPGQAIKGVVRNYIIQEKFESKEEDALKDKDFCDIFGGGSLYNKAIKGNVIFFDSYPLGLPKIDIDVMNVHYREYYEGISAPTDWQNPIPIYFLTVREAKFRFLLASNKKDINSYKIKDKNILDWLREALKEHGIGAKTSVGYGRLIENIKK